jgi:hypothetical protein
MLQYIGFLHLFMPGSLIFESLKGDLVFHHGLNDVNN